MDYIGIYADFLRKYFKPKRKLKVVFDCSNGTAGKVLSELFRKSKVAAIFINSKPDGRFPGHGPNPMAKGAMKQLQETVLGKSRPYVGTPTAVGADLGVIFDADGDRMFLTDDKGRFVHPDETGYLLLQELNPKKYAVSVISGYLLKHQTSNIPHLTSRAGHYFFKKLMREKNIPLGLEHSGHYYFGFKDFSARGGPDAVWDSGILAAIHIMNFVSRLNQPISQYLDKLPKYYRSGEINFKVKNEELRMKIFKKVEKFYKKRGARISKLDGLTAELPDFWINIRPSNTENLLRLNVEAVSEKVLKDKLREIKSLVISH